MIDVASVTKSFPAHEFVARFARAPRHSFDADKIGGACTARLQLRQLLGQQLLGLHALPRRMAAVFECGKRHVGRRVVQK